MDRRNFIKSGLFAAAVGAMNAPKAIAQEAERQVAREHCRKAYSTTIRRCNTARWGARV